MAAIGRRDRKIPRAGEGHSNQADHRPAGESTTRRETDRDGVRETYSWRRSAIGSMRDASRAGLSAAPMATTDSTIPQVAHEILYRVEGKMLRRLHQDRSTG